MSVPSFPIAFPILSKIIVACDVRPYRRSSGSGLENGDDFSIDRGQPGWLADFTTRTLTALEAGQLDAFFASLRGPQRFFTFHDPAREYPLAYMPAGWGSLTRVGGGSFDGTASISAIGNSGLSGAARDTITVGTGSGKLPAGLLHSPGDDIALEEGGKISLHRVLDPAGVTASGGGASTLWVEPEVPAGFTTSATARLYRAAAKWRLLEWQGGRQAGRARQGQVTFKAISTLRTG